jgi:ABC-2 type transport system ATP-binding protein
MEAIVIEDLQKVFKERVAVRGLSLAIEEGTCFALLGTNGAGKTTTIDMLSGLLKPTDGEAYLFGNSILSDMDAIKPLINVSPQETAVAPNLSVFENLVFMGRIYGLSIVQAKDKAESMLEMFRLEDRKKDKAKTLSGGLKRRLSIAMALITDPKILFLDEPTLGLDVRSRRELWHILNQLKKNMTIILTTHYMEEAKRLADRIGIIDEGILRMVGTLEELREETNLFELEEIFLSLTKGDPVL